MKDAVGKHNRQFLFDGVARLSRLPTYLGVGYDQLAQSRLVSGGQDELVGVCRRFGAFVGVSAVGAAGVDVREGQDVGRSLDAALGQV